MVELARSAINSKYCSVNDGGSISFNPQPIRYDRNVIFALKKAFLKNLGHTIVRRIYLTFSNFLPFWGLEYIVLS